MNIVLVAIGGFLGSVARFFLSLKTNKARLGTWIANVTGSVFLAFLLYYYVNEIISEQIWLFLGVGFCGAYTTFSTFSNETLLLIINKNYVQALNYVASSLITSLLAVFIVFIIM